MHVFSWVNGNAWNGGNHLHLIFYEKTIEMKLFMLFILLPSQVNSHKLKIKLYVLRGKAKVKNCCSSSDYKVSWIIE